MATWMQPSLITSVLRSLLQSELSAYRGVPVSSLPDSPAVDSLESLYLASSVAEFFCLHETGVEDRLLIDGSLEAWSQLVGDAIDHTSGLVFRTSGSTGEPKECHHRWEDIEAEARALHLRINERIVPERVVAWLPLHHLYGFMLGVAYPALNGLDVCIAKKTLPPLREGDVVVTVPPRWAYLAKARHNWPTNVLGVSSTAPLPDDTAAQLADSDLTGVMEIYGSSETGGVATRFHSAEPFTLLPHWQKNTTDSLVSADSHHREAGLPDRVVWQEASRFMLAGRHDDQISIGGINISPSEVARELEALPEVQSCSVRAARAGDGQARLKAFVVPNNLAPETVTECLDATINDWPAAKRPVSFTFGDALPTNSIGKLADW